MTLKLKSNLYIGPVNIFPKFCHCIQCSVVCFVSQWSFIYHQPAVDSCDLSAHIICLRENSKENKYNQNFPKLTYVCLNNNSNAFDLASS